MCLTNRQTIVSWPLDLRLDSELLPLLAQPERPKRDAIVPTGALDVAGVDGALLDSLSTAGRSRGRPPVRDCAHARRPRAGLDLRRLASRTLAAVRRTAVLCDQFS
jgi:hypothetical protein